MSLVHNTAYHENATSPITVNPASGATNQLAAPLKPEPAQNAKGVWHYMCSDDCCAGGAGAATACAKCGKTLVYNGTYHQ